jgi:hypothetical protein
MAKSKNRSKRLTFRAGRNLEDDGEAGHSGAYSQGLIQISAVFIKRHQGISGGKKSLSRAGFRKLRSVAEGRPR